MSISWTNTIEDRLLRLERRQERLSQKINALASTFAQQEAETVPAPPAPAAAPAATGAPAAAPIGGGQALAAPGLGMWKPARQNSPHHARMRILQRVQSLNDSVRALSHTVQRLEAICHLLGQCITLTVDPEASPALLHTGSHGAGTGEGLSRTELVTQESGGGNGGALASALTGLLPALLPAQGQGSSAGEGEGGAAGGDQAGGDQAGGGATSLTALLPLLQALAARQGDGGARLANLLGSPAFQQLLGMAGR